MAASRAAQHLVPLRIVVRDPVPDVELRLQSGQSDLVRPTTASLAAVVFDFPVRIALPDGEGPVGFYGPFTQGPPSQRFVYINAGKRAGQPGSCWDRRAKIPLTGIGAALVRRVLELPGSILEVSIAGRDRNNGPVCASVKLAPDAWHLRSSSSS